MAAEQPAGTLDAGATTQPAEEVDAAANAETAALIGLLPLTRRET